MNIIVPERSDLPACAKLYAAAYKTEPWNEIYEEKSVENYLANYLSSNTKCCFAAVEDGRIVGIALGLILPDLEGMYLRIEDFCIDPAFHRKGYGTLFLNLLQEEGKKRACDSILLGTQKNFPSHSFYLKNGFREIESVLLYREIHHSC